MIKLEMDFYIRLLIDKEAAGKRCESFFFCSLSADSSLSTGRRSAVSLEFKRSAPSTKAACTSTKRPVPNMIQCLTKMIGIAVKKDIHSFLQPVIP